MAVNEMSFTQVSTILNSLVQQATGQTAIAPTNTYEFVTAAQTLLKTGYDPILNAINQVLSETIFSIRPYNRKFRGIEATATQWGNHVRKLVPVSTGVEDDQRYKWPVAYNAGQTPPLGDGQSVDPYKIKKPKVLQLNFYGQSVYEDWQTYFRDQLDNAFTGPDELARFWSMITTEQSNKLEQFREEFARGTVANFIGGILNGSDDSRIIHLLTEYNTATGLTLTATSVYQPENFKAFIEWSFARIKSLCRLMTERSQLFQTIVNNNPVLRHTDYNDMRIYLLAPYIDQVENIVMTNIYNDRYLSKVDFEPVTYWQSIESPDSISLTPGFINTDGAWATGDAVEQDNIFGVIFDRDALGYAQTQSWSAPTPFNPAGGYYNIFWHETLKNWNDHTEKGIVLLLD